jgi:hypothetical protein
VQTLIKTGKFYQELNFCKPMSLVLIYRMQCSSFKQDSATRKKEKQPGFSSIIFVLLFKSEYYQIIWIWPVSGMGLIFFVYWVGRVVPTNNLVSSNLS